MKNTLNQMRKQCLVFVFCIITFVNLFISCSSVPKSTFQNSYYSLDYENKSFENVSIDICYPRTKHEYNSGLDSITVSMQLNFVTTFRNYFPEGIKMFSSVTKTGWILFDCDFRSLPEIVEYSIKTKDGLDFFIQLTDSLSFFQEQSTSDFLLFINLITFIGNTPKQADKHSPALRDYESIITINYSIWNTKTSDLIASDQVTTRMKFKYLGSNWPYRGVILKAASEIFERLPMFSK